MIPQARRRPALGLLFITLLMAFPAVSAAQNGFYVKDNDTVVFYGDSITEQRLYTTFVETFIVTRYPRMPVRFVHSGWGGDRVNGGGGGVIDERLRRDVIAYQPTVMTIMLGMNDGGYKAFDDALFERFRAGYEHILQVMKDAVPGLRFTLLQPSPYDDVTQAPSFPGGYNAVLVRYAQMIRELAERNQMATADLNAPMVEALKKANALDPTGAKAIIRDRIHPAAGGHLLMAECLLKAWGATALVTAVEIDAASKQAGRTQNTTLTGLVVDKTISWTQKDGALPMPVNMRASVLPQALRAAADTVDLALKSSDFMEALNQQTLLIRGLQGAKYTLKINGATAGSFSREELGKGINLAALPTPMAAQAAAVHQLTMRRSDLHQLRWRQVQMQYKDDNILRLPTVLDNLDAIDAELAARQRAAAQPAACFYELIPE